MIKPTAKQVRLAERYERMLTSIKKPSLRQVRRRGAVRGWLYVAARTKETRLTLGEAVRLP